MTGEIGSVTGVDPGPGGVRVLYLAGSGRSGSTLITTILGQFDGAFAAGELRYLWRRGLLERRPCGCGLPIPRCPLWQRVLAELPGVDAAGMAARLPARLRMRGLPALLVRRWRGRPAVADHPDDGRLAALYAAVARQSAAHRAAAGGAAAVPPAGTTATGADARPVVVVDSSKLPPYGALLDDLPGIDLRVLHLVRDPRATGFSWRRRRQLDGPADGATEGQAGAPVGGATEGQLDGPAGGRLMSRPPLWKASLLWLVWNAATVWLWGRPTRPAETTGASAAAGRERYLRVRYEDFAAAPEETIRRVARFAGLDPAGSPFAGPDRVRLAPTHSVAGNPVRHRTGTVPVRLDDEWREGLGGWGHLLVTVLTSPLLRSFGYPLRRVRTRRREPGEG